MDFDVLYGPCLPFARDASEAEMGVNPRSLEFLNEETAPALIKHLENAESLLLSQVVHATMPILWLIDEAGQIRFAMEEVIARDTGYLSYILPRNGPPMRETDVRLGHPALLEPVNAGEAKSARIGGEIFYDPIRRSELSWVLTNNSGRFGKRPHIKREYLENAGKAFEALGVSLRTFFIYTKEKQGEGE